MPQIINTNISSINAQRNLNKSQGALQTSLQRLSSGLRINSAKDDAAGLAISNRFTTQVRGLNVAVRNANDGISFAQTTESALEEIATALQRMRDLGVQSANDTNSQSDRLSLQAEVTQLVSEIERIAQTTTFNNRPVLDGSNATLSFHIGANANQTVSVSGVDARSSALGSQPGMVQSTGDRVQFIGNGSTDLGTQGIQEVGALTEANDISNFTIRLDSINTVDAVDITDTVYGGNIATVTTTDLKDRFDDNYGGGLAKAIAERVNAIRVRGEDSLQGVYATAETSFRGSDLEANDYSGTIDDTNAPDTNVGQGVIDNGDLIINGVDIGPVTFQVNDASGTLVNAINAKTSVTGVEAAVDKNGELVLTAEDGRDIIVSASTASVTNDLFGGGDELTTDRFSANLVDLRVTGRITVTGQDTLNFTGTNNDELGLDATGLAATGSEDNVQAVGTIANADVTTREAANILIESVDSALDQINTIRGELGAIQNRFESTIRNLSSISESLAAANSRILDADFAAETAQLSKNQVLQQAGISVLAQANGLPQQVLSLLQG
ncbi:flagellin [Gammaproteobacteria bacterium 45_16_T64]|nr:flagellin [Gammaproteobacteria bacterium 45_16_T64]